MRAKKCDRREKNVWEKSFRERKKIEKGDRNLRVKVVKAER